MKLLSRKWCRLHDECQISTRTATESATKTAISHTSVTSLSTQTASSPAGTVAIHWRHSGGPPMRVSGVALNRGSPDSPGYELPPSATFTPSTCPVQPLAGVPLHSMNHHPVAAPLTSDSGALPATFPGELRKNRRTGGSWFGGNCHKYHF